MRWRRTGLIAIVALFHVGAPAVEMTFFDLALGYPAMTIALDPRLQPNLNSKVAFQTGVWRTLRGLPLGLGLENTVFMGGDFGTLPLLETKALLTYFFGGRPISDYQINDEIVVKSRGWSPFLKFNPGLMFMNIRSPVYTSAFGSSAPMLGFAVGIMIPVGLVDHWQVELSYATTVNATDASKSPVSASGYLLSAAYALGLP